MDANKQNNCDDQRAARLAQLSHNRQERMSLETPEVRQRRLQLDRDGHQQTRQLHKTKSEDRKIPC